VEVAELDPANPGSPSDRPNAAGTTRTAALALAALGVVFGDIGTSPLYALRETFDLSGLEVSRANVLGVLSLVFWSLVLVIAVKYLAFVMRASNRGEGGILALASLIRANRGRSWAWVLVLLGAFGTAMLYGDGAITPAISVLSAVEGLGVAQPSLEGWVIPIAIVILIGLFAIQRRGSASIGRLFGPVMIVWFATIAVLGISHLRDDPGVINALNPRWAVEFFANNTFTGFVALGSLFLVVTGGEALYADMGHFGRRSIIVGWYGIVLPGLLLCYFGQGALLLADPAEVDQPFYALAPDWGVLPLTVLATLATVIASQALITGVFSLTMQASSLGWLPRVRIRHTSAAERGQIYVPAFNWGLLIACVSLVLAFRTSGNLAAAYGLAVTATMLITTLLFFHVATTSFRWPRLPTAMLCGAFLVVDIAFFGSNLLKFPSGGWFPVLVALLIFTAMTTWRHGRELLGARLHRGETPLHEFLADNEHLPRVPGTGVYLFSLAGSTPPAMVKNVEHNEVLHERLVVLSVVTEDVPFVAATERSEVHQLGPGAWGVVLRYGYMDRVDVPGGLTEGDAAQLGLIDDPNVTFFVGSERIQVTAAVGMAPWRERLFAVMHRNATPAERWFELPAGRVMSVGSTVEI
jgi:KUP system potassium uptake protein